MDANFDSVLVLYQVVDWTALDVKPSPLVPNAPGLF